MTRYWQTRRRGGLRAAWAWTIGLLILLALGVLAWSLLSRRPAASPATEAGAAPRVEDGEGQPPVPAMRAVDLAAGSQSVSGVVHLPDGRPAPGTTVSLYRALTAWPEWRRERIDQPAITGADGRFRFRVAQRHGLLVGFEHPAHAGGLEPVQSEAPMRLLLLPGFELYGVVRTPTGATVANATVAIESVLTDRRRTLAVTTAANGSYRFTNLSAGPVRLVARHDSWQPVAVPVHVVGDVLLRDLTFERQAMMPLRGRITSVAAQAPIEGASVELLPSNGTPGLADPITASTAADGSFLLSGLPRGTMRVLVRHPAYGAFTRTLTIGPSTAEVAYEMPQRSQVSGQLLSAAGGNPFFGGEVLELRDSAGQLEYTTVGSDGRFRFAAGLSPGTATITVVGGSFAFARTQARAASFRIEDTPRTEVDFDVERPTIVRGRILDATGKALAGAAVSQTKVLAENARSIGSAMAQFDFGMFGSRVAQLFGDDRDQLLAMSRADGSFEILGQKPGLLIVRVELVGHGSRWLSFVVPSGIEPLDLGPVTLPAGCRIQGRVLRGGRGLAGAAVTVVGQESQAVTMSGDNGLFVFEDLQPGEYAVRARLPSMPMGSGEQRVVTQPQQAPRDIVLVLEAGRLVRGVVSGSDGQPVPSALITVRGAVGQTTLTDNSGDFLLELPARAIELQVSLGDRSRQRIVEVPLDQQRVAIRLDTPPTTTLVAQVAGLPSRKRLAGALLRYCRLDEAESVGVRTRWVDLQNGELRWSLCPIGRVRIEIWCEGYAPFVTERDFVPNDEHNIGEILLEPGGRISGVVHDAAGRPVADAAVWLGDETDVDLFEPRMRTGPDGAFQLTGVTSRSARVVVRAVGFAPLVRDLVLPQDVLSGEPIDIELAPGAMIEVQVGRSPGGSARVELRQAGRIVAVTDPDETGRAWFQNRSAGSYTVALLGEGGEKAVVVAPGVEVVRVQLP